MLYLSFDDTDSLKGMCTTFLATEMIKEFDDLDLIGYPWLVRLNPNVPWKTRGNGALCLRLGYGGGGKLKIGSIDGREIGAFRKCRGHPKPKEILARAVAVLEEWAEFDDVLTNPAVAVLDHKPPPSSYWKAVRDIVPIIEARRVARKSGESKTYKNGRGIVGCVAAAAWRPLDRTYEILTYRHQSRWGTDRIIDPESVKRMDRKFPATFNNYDYLNEKVTIAPSSPCPILFGIRAEEPDDLVDAMQTIGGERACRWLVFETNQGTDEHLLKPEPSIRGNTSVIVRGRVTQAPRTIAGGHVIFRIDHDGGLDCAAYEPSKQFRRVARALFSGDSVVVAGSVRDRPRTINVEKLRIVRLAREKEKVSNPRCPTCGKSMKSIGRDAGYRCMDCRTKAPADAGVWREVPRSLRIGWYEPPVSARRHISKPLKRMRVTANALPDALE